MQRRLTTSLPCETLLCHCNPCRYSSGALFAGWCTLSSAPDPAVLEKCTQYGSSMTHNRYFCSTCGTKVFIHCHRRPDGTARDKWVAFGGAIDPLPPTAGNVFDIQAHIFLKDTVDGGIAAMTRELGGKPIPCLIEDEGSNELSSGAVDGLVKDGSSQPHPSEDETLRVECHGGGVSLRIQPANHSDRSISQLDRYIAKDKNGTPTNKHMAFFCVCRYCRLGTGVPLTPFAYIPPIQVLNANTGKPVAQPHESHTPARREANAGLTLKYVWASDWACRGFCQVCGASVFYSTDLRKEILNVHAGLLRAEEGVLARRWLSWQWGRTAWKDEEIQKDVTDAWRATVPQV